MHQPLQEKCYSMEVTEDVGCVAPLTQFAQRRSKINEHTIDYRQSYLRLLSECLFRA